MWFQKNISRVKTLGSGYSYYLLLNETVHQRDHKPGIWTRLVDVIDMAEVHVSIELDSKVIGIPQGWRGVAATLRGGGGGGGGLGDTQTW